MPMKKIKLPEEKHVDEDERMADQVSNGEEDDGSDSDSDDYQGNEQIQVDFEGRNPIDSDFHGIRQLLKQLFLKAHINLSELSDLIIGQNYIGSVISQANTSEDEDDDDDDMSDSNLVFGITTAINVSNKPEIGCIQQIRTYILDKSEQYANETVKSLFRDTIADTTKSIGFLINERFVNIPPQISVPALENLWKELQRANRKNMAYNFEYFLMIIKFHRKITKHSKSTEDVYSNEEEEMVCEEAIGSFEYSVKTEIDAGAEGDGLTETNNRLTPFRKIILFPTNKLPTIINSVKQLIE